MSNTQPRQRGSILLSLVFVLPFLALILAAHMSLTASNVRLARGDVQRTHAQMATDAGLDIAMSEINVDEDWAGTASPVTLHNTTDLRTTYEVTVTTNGDAKELTAVGRSFAPASSTTPTAIVTIKADLRPVTSGDYSVVSGVGGLTMNNSAKILGGDVFINGRITLSNTAQIGLTTNPVNLQVAHQSCPSPATAAYPTICASGENGQPISISNSAHIYGDVKANNQTSASGMSNPGLTANSGVSSQPLPAYDRDAHKAAVATTQTAAASGCSSGTRTWPANLKITGNVTVSNSCKVTVMGNVWITGTLRLSNSAELIVSNTLGATRPVIMVDGSDAQFTNSSILRSNASNMGFQIITYRSDASCSPDCADVTGTDLFNSQNDLSIELSNSSSAPNTVFYARWTRVRVNNSGQIGALIGQTVDLSNSSTITFDSAAAVGTITHWVIDGYRRVF